jgi:hypothetical protein
MFAVVRNKDLAYYVICCKWLAKYDNDPNMYTFFPPPTKHAQYVKKQVDNQDGWEYEQVEIMLNHVEGTFFIC